MGTDTRRVCQPTKLPEPMKSLKTEQSAGMDFILQIKLITEYVQGVLRLGLRSGPRIHQALRTREGGLLAGLHPCGRSQVAKSTCYAPNEQSQLARECRTD
jgi:hypothetical protein